MQLRRIHVCVVLFDDAQLQSKCVRFVAGIGVIDAEMPFALSLALQQTLQQPTNAGKQTARNFDNGVTFFF